MYALAWASLSLISVVRLVMYSLFSINKFFNFFAENNFFNDSSKKKKKKTLGLTALYSRSYYKILYYKFILSNSWNCWSSHMLPFKDVNYWGLLSSLASILLSNQPSFSQTSLGCLCSPDRCEFSSFSFPYFHKPLSIRLMGHEVYTDNNTFCTLIDTW